MPISKRTRYEVLRRDNYTCRYCRSTENPLTVDHVIPVSLGGSGKPDNLVGCCKDCNLGKASSSPDASVVAQVEEDAIRWARAMALVSERVWQARAERLVLLDHFKEDVWNQWLKGDKPCRLPPDWQDAVNRQLKYGLDMSDLDYAVRVTMAKGWIEDEFRYFMGVCRTMIMQRVDAAKAAIEAGEV